MAVKTLVAALSLHAIGSSAACGLGSSDCDAGVPCLRGASHHPRSLSTSDCGIELSDISTFGKRQCLKMENTDWCIAAKTCVALGEVCPSSVVNSDEVAIAVDVFLQRSLFGSQSASRSQNSLATRRVLRVQPTAANSVSQSLDRRRLDQYTQQYEDPVAVPDQYVDTDQYVNADMYVDEEVGADKEVAVDGYTDEYISDNSIDQYEDTPVRLEDQYVDQDQYEDTPVRLEDQYVDQYQDTPVRLEDQYVDQYQDTPVRLQDQYVDQYIDAI